MADEREEIALGVATGRSFADIAVQLGRPTSTVSREVDRNGGRGRYRATRAQREADRRARRPKPRRLVTDRRLAREVAKGRKFDAAKVERVLFGRLAGVGALIEAGGDPQGAHPRRRQVHHRGEAAFLRA